MNRREETAGSRKSHRHNTLPFHSHRKTQNLNNDGQNEQMASFLAPPHACGHRLVDAGSSSVNKCAAPTKTVTSAADENIRLLSPPWSQSTLLGWRRKKSQAAFVDVTRGVISPVKSWTFGEK